MPAIVVQNLVKHFSIAMPTNGSLGQNLKRYIFPRTQAIAAVDNISFTLKKRERG